MVTGKMFDHVQPALFPPPQNGWKHCDTHMHAMHAAVGLAVRPFADDATNANYFTRAPTTYHSDQRRPTRVQSAKWNLCEPVCVCVAL